MKPNTFSLASVIVVLVGVGIPLSAQHASPTASQWRFDVNHLSTMVDHHCGAVRLAELGARRLAPQEARELCSRVAVEVRDELGRMRTLLRDTAGGDSEPRLPVQIRKQLEYLASLPSERFEENFWPLLLGHEIKAAELALEALDRGFDVGMLALSSAMLTRLGDEIVWLRIGLGRRHGQNDLEQAPVPGRVDQ